MKSCVTKRFLLLSFWLNAIATEPLEIEVTKLTSDGKITVGEYSRVGSFVAMVIVNSKDRSVMCSTGDENFSLVKVISNHYKITTRVQLDRESRRSHVIVVVCEDQLTHLNNSVSVTVIVGDENDNAPKFETLNYDFKVEEGTEVGTFIFKVVATDLDIKNNGEISYYISPPHSGFRIDPVSGEVFTTVRQDREMRAHVTFDVIAQDGGIPRLKTTTSVTIDITDINDNSPVFPRPEFRFHVSKRSPIGTDVGHVFAFDVDEGLNGHVTYSESQSGGNLFLVDSTGLIQTSAEIINVVGDQYNLVIVASDHGVPSLSTQAQVEILIVDSSD